MEVPAGRKIVTITGNINFTNVIRIRRKGEQEIEQHTHVQFDFSQVGNCDSSALVLLMAWKRFAQHRGRQVKFVHVPSSVMALAAVCNVQSMIEIE